MLIEDSLGFNKCSLSLFEAFPLVSVSLPCKKKTLSAPLFGSLPCIIFIPAFQLMFTPLGYPGVNVFGSINLTMYNAPALFAILVNLVGIAIVRCLFKEQYNGIVEKDKVDVLEDSRVQTTGTTGLPPYDKVAVAVCNFTRFTQMFVTTTLQTLVYTPK